MDYILPIKMVNALRSWFHPKDRHIYLSSSQYIISRRVAWEAAFSLFSNLPGRVGFWSMGDVQRSTGNVYDNSPQGRTLTYTGNPQFNIWDNLVPYIDLDGTGDYLLRADETDLDIAGSETIYAANVRGLTLGGWLWLDNAVSASRFMTKGTTTGAQRAYSLNIGGGQIDLTISSTGANAFAAGGLPISTGAWHYVAARFKPSLELKLWLDDSSPMINTASIPSSLFNSTGGFAIGAQSDGTQTMDGRAALCFLCANALPDEMIEMLYEQSKILFGL